MSNRIQKSMIKKFTSARLLSSACVLAISGLTTAVSAQPTNSQYSALPPITSREAGSIDIMLTLSVDHQLFREAYNDYDDIYQPENETTPRPEVTYEHRFSYAGYFNSELCYAYQEGRFIAVGETDGDNYCPDLEDAGGGWSGNFLNWVSMTRLDMVRQVLYGGHRSTDEANQTILERAPLVQDAHSFAKYYSGDDIQNLTDGLPIDPAPGCGDGGEEDARTCAGYTFCNTSEPVQTMGIFSQHQDYRATPPLIRAVKGNYSLWASNERFQCVTLDEIPLGGSVAYDELPEDVRDYMLEYGINGNKTPDFSGIWARWVSPRDSQVADFIVRVEPCNAVEMEWQEGIQESDNGEAGGDLRCQSYPGENVTPKPVGLLQDPSLSHINFGLLTGSYDSNMDWGVLRKAVTNFNETEVDDDGTFLSPSESIVSSLNALRLVDYRYFATNQDRNPNNAALENGTYNGIMGDNDASTTLCEWGRLLDSDSPPECRNWGNPFGELLAESYRYFAAKAGVTGISARLQPSDLSSESADMPGLTIASWPSADGESNSNLSCTSRNVLAFNASGVSYDDSLGSNSLGTLNSLGFTQEETIASLVNTIGGEEIEEGQTYFVGEDGTPSIGSDDVGQCSAKQVEGENFAAVRGICPETPRQKGSYYGSGLSYFAHTQDLNPGTTVKDNVSTYGITLAGALPNIQVNAGDKDIVIIPACRNRGNGGETKGNCALVDFRPILPDNPNAPVTEYYVGWEDSEQGGDYDLDLSGMLTYSVSNNSNLHVDSKIIYESASDLMEFGFSISGTGTALDGIYFPSKVDADRADLELIEKAGLNDHGTLEGLKAAEIELTQSHIQGFQNYDPVDDDTRSDWCKDVNNTVPCENVSNGRHQRVTFNLVGEGSTAGKFLKDPLYYAVKWGSFKYESTDEDPKPTELSQWASDRLDQFGDPLPRGYDTVRNPKNLKTQFADIINNLLSDITTGTASGIATNTSTGEGLSIQTFYMPELRSESEVVTWTGAVSGLFRDQYGNLREDSNSNGRLDDTDKAVTFFFDTADSVTKARLYTLQFETIEDDPDDEGTEDDDETDGSDETELNDDDILLENPSYELVLDSTVTLNELNYVWDLNQALNALDSNTDDAGVEGDVAFTEHKSVNQALTGGGRHIFTTLDDFDSDDAEGRILTQSDAVNFVVPDSDDDTDFELLTDYLDITDSDTLDAEKLVNFIRGVEGLDGVRSRTLGDHVYRLGDVMHSTPTVVGRPQSLRLASIDSSYAEYRQAQWNRRQVAYVGGNDGMLHAINLGFYDGTRVAFYDNYSEDEDGVGTFSNNDGTGALSTLGRELWAYVPFNVLPHLKWLASPNYQHTYYMDGPIQTFDVKIFDSEDTDHPGGWGTIIVAGMRQGGGPYAVENGDDTQTLRSAYVIFDVTDPLDPELLAEVTHPNLGFTTSNVDLISRRQPHAEDGDNDWYLVFGSGSTDLGSAISNQNAHLFYLDLNSLIGESTPSLNVVDTGQENSFVGGITVEDWDGNYQSDAVYFGVVGDGSEGNMGALMYSTPSWGDGGVSSLSEGTQLLTDVDQPFSAAPLGVSDKDGNWWLFAGTGRYYVSDDLESIEQNSLYGIRVNGESYGTHASSIANNSLYDVTDLNVSIRAEEGNSNQRVTQVTGADGDPVTDSEGNVLNTIDELTAEIQNYSGWRRDYQHVDEVNFLSPLIVNDTLLSDTFRPASGNSCDAQGKSYKYILDMFNGMPQTRLRRVLFSDQTFGAPGEDAEQLGVAQDSEGQVTGVDVTSESTIFTRDTGGGVNPIDGGLTPLPPKRQSWREIPLEGIPN